MRCNHKQIKSLHQNDMNTILSTNYINFIIDFIETPVNIISIGPGRDQIIKL